MNFSQNQITGQIDGTHVIEVHESCAGRRLFHHSLEIE